MIPWWGWVVIWVCLSFAVLAVLAVSALRLFSKGIAVLDEFESLILKVELLELDAVEVELARTELALVSGAEKIRRSRALVREAALERTAARLEVRIDRAKRITQVDASTREWFKAR